MRASSGHEQHGDWSLTKVLHREPSEHPARSVILLCGGVLTHRKRLIDSISKATKFTVIRCAQNQEEVLSVCRLMNVSVMVAHQAFVQQMPRHTLAQLTNFGRGCHVLVILDSESIDPKSVAELLGLGCGGFLPRQFSAKLFRRAILAMLHREIWAPRALISELLSDLLRAASLKEQNGLTPQETRILEMTARGYKNSAIADALFISMATVRWHKRRINRKLKATDQPRLPQMKASPSPREQAAG